MGEDDQEALRPTDHRAGQVQRGRCPVRPRDHEVRGHRHPADQRVDVALEGGDHRLGHEGGAGHQLRPVRGVRRDLGHEHVELPFEPGQQDVELGAGLGLGPGQAHGGLGLVHRAGHLHHGRVLGHPAPVEEAGGAVVAGPGVDLQHGVLTGPMLNERRPHGRRQGPPDRPRAPGRPTRPGTASRPLSLEGYGRPTHRIELPPGRARARRHLRRRHGDQPAAAGAHGRRLRWARTWRAATSCWW